MALFIPPPHYFPAAFGSFRLVTFVCVYNWVAPCKLAPNDYFVAIFKVAPNRLKFGMSTLFVLKNIPVGFFSRMQKHMDKIVSNSIPLPLCSSPNNVEFQPLRAKTLCMYLLCYWREIEGGGCEKVGGGGWTFKNVFEALLPRLWKKKTQGHFLTQKE